MKKTLFLVLIATFGLMLTGCKENVEKKVDNYYEDMGKALRKGDVGEYAKICADFQKWMNNLPEEERNKAALHALSKTDDISSSLGKAYGKALKKGMKEYEKAYKDAVESYQDALEDAADEFEDAMEDFDIDDSDDSDDDW